MDEHRHQIRVRYVETDAQGVAHHSAYVAWLEEARIEMLRAAGQSYRDLEAAGVLMPVTDLSLRYRRPLRFDDEIELVTRVAVDGRFRLRFSTGMRCAEQLVAEGEVTVAAVDHDGRPQRLGDELLAAIAP